MTRMTVLHHSNDTAGDHDSLARGAARVALGTMLIVAGTSHLTWARKEFQAQVPDLVPLDPDTTVVASGGVEISLGAALVAVPRRHRRALGRLAALFFIAVFPGNISQFVHRRDGFGLNSDATRFARLFFQPVLVWAALASTRT